MRFPAVDEHGNRRYLVGSVAQVHKPLGSAADIGKNHDTFIWDGGGAIMPRSGAIARGMRKAFRMLCEEHGKGELLPLYREGRLYNFYLRKAGPTERAPELSPVDAGAGGSSSSAGPASTTGFPRRVSQP